jgi:hypothetical protein
MTTKSKPKSTRKPKPRKKSAEQLMSSPEAMLKWLRTLPPQSVVTKDMCANNSCLGAAFLQHSGFPDADFGGFTYTIDAAALRPLLLPRWFELTFDLLASTVAPKRITAARAIAAIERASAR